MNEDATGLMARLRTLERDFDRSFTLPSPEKAAAQVHLLAVQLADTRMTIRLAEVASVKLDPVLTAMPGAPRSFLGLATITGQPWPVYDLGVVLGQAPQTRPRVLCLLRGTLRIAFAVEHFLGLLRVAPEAITKGTPALGSDEAVLEGDAFVPLISLTAAARKCIPLSRAGHTNEEGAPT